MGIVVVIFLVSFTPVNAVQKTDMGNLKFLGAVILLFLSSLCFAQEKKKTQITEVFFQIDSVYSDGNSFFARINAGRNLGVEKGLLVKSYTRWAPASATAGVKNFSDVGFGWVVSSEAEKAICIIDHYQKNVQVNKYDLIAINVEVPMLPYRSIFSDLAFINIEFGDIAREPLYNLQRLWTLDSKKAEDSILNIIINDIKETYQMVKDDSVSFGSLFVPLAGSRFKGRSVLTVMRDIDREALMGYLTFVKNFPGKYIGQNFKANETFATWVLNNAPYTKPDVYTALFPVYKDKNKLASLLPEYSYDIKNSNLVASFTDEAVTLSNARKKNEAETLMDFARTLAYILDDTAGKASFHLNNGQLLQDAEKFKEAIGECDLSIKFALLSNEKETELNALIKKAYCQYKISLFAEAKNTLSLAENKTSEYRKSIGEAVYRTVLQKKYQYEGWINNGEGNFDLALKNFEAAIVINNLINSYESRIKNAEYFAFIGRVYNDQGKPEKALDAFNQAATFYTGVKDQYNYAKVLNNIGYSYYNNGQYRQSLATLQNAFTQLLQLGDQNNAGYSKSLIGSGYWKLGTYDSAVLAHKEAILLRQKSNNKSGQAFSWQQIGELYQLSGLKKEALQAYDSAGSLYQAVNDLSGQAEVYIKAGKVYFNDENYYKAAQLYEKAKGVTAKTTVEALFNLGNAWSEVDVEKAKKYYLECKLKSDSAGNTSYQFYAARALAGIFYRQHEFEKGDTYYEACLSLANQLNTAFADGYCLTLKGQKFSNLSALDSTLHYYYKALAIYDTVSKEDYIWQLLSISGVYVSKGDFAKVEEILLKAANMAKATNNNIALGSSLQDLSFLYGLLGEFPKGFRANDSAMMIFKHSGNILRLASTYVSRGSIYKGSGEYKKSIEAMLFADSIYIAEKTGEYRKTVLNNIGVTYYNQADYQKAMDYFNQSATYIKAGIVNEDFLLMRANIAECFYYLKKIKEAEAISLEAYPQAKKRDLNRISSGMAIVLGRIYFDQDDLQKAYVYFDEARNYAISSKERDKLIETLTQIGKIDVKLGKKEQAYKNFAEAIAITREYNIASGWEAYYEMGVMFYNQSNFDSSIIYFRPAVDLLNKYTQNVFGDDKAKKLFNNDPRKADLYFKLSYSYSKTGKPEQSFAYANLSGLAGLKELGGTQTVPGFEKETRKLEDLQQKANALRASAEKQTGATKIEIVKQLQVAEKEYTNYLISLVQQDEKFNTYYPQEANPNSFLKYKGDLPDDVAVVLYLLNNNNLMVFTLTNENLSIQVDSLNKEMSQTINAFIRLTKRPDKASGTGSINLRSEVKDEEDALENVSFTDVSASLYQLLISNVYSKIKNKKRICIIPNGILSNLPFQCLGQKKADGAFHFLIEEHSVFYTNDISIFYKSRKLVPDKSDLSSFAAFGVPDATLHYNTEEVKEIGRLIGAEKMVYADARATEALAKSSLTQKKFVHFATHGVLNYSQDFSKSYLKFLPDKDTSLGNNGKLTISEIQQLSMEDCDLVTLSACETAVNKQLIQGWNISPANAFLLRRVKSVVASLWKVDDEATSILMNEFYTNLNKKMDKVDALRMAQVKLSNNPKYSHPFYWGAFVLYGEWR